MRNLLLFLLLISISSFGQNEFRLERVRTIPSNATVNDILVSGDHVYVGTTIGLYKISSNNLETRLISKRSIDAICAVGKDEIWVSIEHRFLQNLSNGKVTQYNAPGLHVRDIDYSKGKIWAATNQGIITVLTRTNELGKIEYDKKSGLPSNNVSFIHIDKQKQMWIGTDKGIVFINAKDKWRTYEKKLSMEAMHYNHEGLWLVSNEEMWVVDDFNRWYPAAIDKGLRRGKIRDITADSTGRLYMASEILVRYDPYDETIESYENNTAIVSKVCTSVESDRDNRIWLGTKGGGLFLFGYADQAKTIQDLVVARDRRMQEEEKAGLPVVKEELVAFPDEALLASIGGELEVGSENSSAASINSDKREDIISLSNADAEKDDEMNTVSPRSQQNNELNSVTQESDNDSEKQIAPLHIKHVINNQILCAEEKAEVSLLLEGGQTPYSIINEAGEEVDQNLQLVAGTYTYRVLDASGQEKLYDLRIEGKEKLSVKIVSLVSPSALGRKDGNVKVKVNGGTAPYSLSWSNGEKGDRARRLENGMQTLEVVDANGCKLTEEINLKAKIMADLDIRKVTVGQKLEIKNIYYDADSTEITSDSHESLEEIYEFLVDNQEVKIEVGGHTNSLPTDEYCDRISTARAKSVADYLVSKGIPSDRVTYKGYGKRNPIASNQTKEGRRRNQRVEIEIISK